MEKEKKTSKASYFDELQVFIKQTSIWFNCLRNQKIDAFIENEPDSPFNMTSDETIKIKILYECKQNAMV